MGNTAIVDAIYGNDSTASVGGTPYLTVTSAISNVTSGQSLWILPGTYNLSSEITIPTGVSIVGMTNTNVILQQINISKNTTLITMGYNTCIENVTISLISASHYNIKAVLFNGSTSFNSILKFVTISINNASANSEGISDITGIELAGTLEDTYSFNAIKNNNINIFSNGSGNKRGVLVSNTNNNSIVNSFVYIAQPRNISSTGSYVGIETNDTTGIGSIQIRSTTIKTIPQSTGQLYTASDILQTTPVISSPNYLSSYGIQLCPGADLISNSAGELGFTTSVYPIIINYGLRGNIHDGNNGYLWQGTQKCSPDFPDTTTPPAYFLIQQNCILYGISAALNTSPSSTYTVTLLVKYTPISTGIITTSNMSVILSDGNLYRTFYNKSLNLKIGDRLHLQLSYTGTSNNNLASDLNVQLNIF